MEFLQIHCLIEVRGFKHVLKTLQRTFGARLNFSSSYHPEMDGQASKNINGSNSSELEPIVLYDPRPAFAFEESMKLSAVNVLMARVENPT